MDKLKNIVLSIGASVVAEKMGENNAQTIYNWLQRESIPDGKVRLLCEAINFQITPHQLRPDMYPHPQDGLPENLRKLQAA
jgi:hypothetical protein